jgi:hypothetical protein
MTKKQKIIIAISFLLFTVPSVSSAGCFGEKPIINGVSFGCISAWTSICKNSISLKNDCNESFYYYNAKNCSLKETPSKLPFYKKVMSETGSFIHDNFIEIPPNWSLVYDGIGTQEICEEYYGYCIEIYCDKGLFAPDENNKNKVFMNFGIDALRQYKIEGIYKQDDLKSDLANPANRVYLIIKVILVLCVILYFVLRKTKHKK